MFNFDEPGFPIALLAILGGLRLAVYVAERLAGTAVNPSPLPMTPDEPAEAAACRSMLRGRSRRAVKRIRPRR